MPQSPTLHEPNTIWQQTAQILNIPSTPRRVHVDAGVLMSHTHASDRISPSTAGFEGCTRGRDSKTPRAITISISTPLAVRQSQLSRTGHSMTMASVLSRQRVVLRSTRWEGPCIMDTGPIPAGWIRAVSWSTETPDHISLRPPCSSDHPRSTSSYLVAFGANPSGSRGASGLPPLHPPSIDRGTRLC